VGNKAEYGAVASILILTEGSLTILEKCVTVCQDLRRPTLCLMPSLQGYQLLLTEEQSRSHCEEAEDQKVAVHSPGRNGRPRYGLFPGQVCDDNGEMSMADLFALYSNYSTIRSRRQALVQVL
jgi:hypothetical protein